MAFHLLKKNKATTTHIGMLKSQLARLRTQMMVRIRTPEIVEKVLTFAAFYNRRDQAVEVGAMKALLLLGLEVLICTKVVTLHLSHICKDGRVALVVFDSHIK